MADINVTFLEEQTINVQFIEQTQTININYEYEQGPQGLRGLKWDKWEQWENGKSAYEVAVLNGFTWTQTEWLATIKGEKWDKGEKGDIWLKWDKWDTGLNGTNWKNGSDWNDWLSAYQVALSNWFVWSEAEWLLSLKWEKGDKWDNGTNGTNGTNGINWTNWIDWNDGQSAYEIAVANWFSGTLSQWLLSLKWEKWDKWDAWTNWTNWIDGVDWFDWVDWKSAYELAVLGWFSGTQAEWIASLKWEKWEKGDKWDKGDPGETGTQVSVWTVNTLTWAWLWVQTGLWVWWTGFTIWIDDGL